MNARNFETRTTNHLEGWHNSLGKKPKKPHVNIFEMITQLKTEENDHRVQRALLDGGNVPKPMRKKYRKLNQRLECYVSKFETEQIDLMSYVRSVAYNLEEPAQ